MARTSVKVNSPAAIGISRRIDWIDTDAAGIHHWSTFARLTDAAEALLFDRLNLMEAYMRLPRRAVDVIFHLPLRFNDVVEVHTQCLHVGTSSVQFGFEIRLANRLASEGTTTGVLTGEDHRSTPWPHSWRMLLETSGELLGEALDDRMVRSTRQQRGQEGSVD